MPLKKNEVSRAVKQWTHDKKIGVIPESAKTYRVTGDDVWEVLKVPLVGTPLLLSTFAVGGAPLYLAGMAVLVGGTVLYATRPQRSGYWLAKPRDSIDAEIRAMKAPKNPVLESQASESQASATPVLESQASESQASESQASATPVLESQASESQASESQASATPVSETQASGESAVWWGEALQEALNAYGVKALVVAYDDSSPTVTIYELEPERGYNISKIENFGQNFSRDVGLPSGRSIIVVPNIGNGRAGLYLPKMQRQFVALTDHLDAPELRKQALPMLLGIGVDGKVVTEDLIAAPHAIIGGTTRSGKTSAGLAMLVALAYRRSPKQVRYTLIDPKRVGLQLLNNLPHCRTASVTNMERALTVLESVVALMHKRYEAMERMSVQDIQEYNAAVTPDSRFSYEVVVVEELSLAIKNKIPILDEEGKATRVTVGQMIERALVELTSAGRAAGVHCLFMTQRFSADIFDGELRDNTDMGICMRVRTADASRMIIGEAGGERLTGLGDCLATLSTQDAPVRVQATYADSESIKSLTQQIKEKWTQPSNTRLSQG